MICRKSHQSSTLTRLLVKLELVSILKLHPIRFYPSCVDRCILHVVNSRHNLECSLRLDVLRCLPGQDEAVAERMLEKVQSFIHEAREGVSQTLSEGMEGDGAGKAEQEPLELEVRLASVGFGICINYSLRFSLLLPLFSRPHVVVLIGIANAMQAFE